MIRTLYTRFIKPTQLDEDLRNRELVLNVLLVGTFLFELLALGILLASFTVGSNHYLGLRIAVFSVILLITFAAHRLSRSGHYPLATWIVLSMYTLFTVGAAIAWGITLPATIALYGLLIILCSILLGARYSLYGSVVVVLIIFILQYFQRSGALKPDLTWSKNMLDPGIVIGFCIIYGVIGLVTWLFNVRMEHSLERAQRAELNLKRQRDLLETKVQERTRELQAAQFERVQQLYRFAELGQISTALLHELAGHLTTLSLDIEGLEAKDRSKVLQRAKLSIRYLDDMVLRVREQLQGKSDIRTFNIASETEEVIGILKHRAVHAGVALHLSVPSNRATTDIQGESVRYRQLVANVIANGIDAYEGVKIPAKSKRVNIAIATDDTTVTITVTDWGKGVTAEQRLKLFEPFYSTKQVGMGMGLSIARQLTEERFKGSLLLDSATTYTRFIISIPRV
ncbi:MAG TPA: ATP-binding protein [Candidatus Saccharimonadales bacterium]|nr:ATP-binding protein [Candidatus Saccharimonadales bacterium]